MGHKWISVIIPAFNEEKYIRECLDSIVKQTIGIDHIEVIIIDDASTDNSLQYILYYKQLYPDSIRVIPLKENGGQAHARNIGMFYATAPFLTFVDADDWVEVNIYEKLLDVAVKYNCDLTQCSEIEHVDGKVRYIELGNTQRYYEIRNVEERNAFLREYKSVGLIGVSVYRTSWLKEHQFVFKNFTKYEDNYWSGITGFYVNSCFALPECLYHYRRNEKSNSVSRNDKGHFERLRIELELLEYYLENGLFNNYYDLIRERFLNAFYVNTLHIICCQFDYFPLEQIQDMQSIVKDVFPDYMEFCKLSEKFINPIITVAFDFPLNVWEEYKKAYLEWVQDGREEEIVRWYLNMRNALGI